MNSLGLSRILALTCMVAFIWILNISLNKDHEVNLINLLVFKH